MLSSVTTYGSRYCVRLDVDANTTTRQITVELQAYGLGNPVHHVYPADEFGKALDDYEEIAEKMRVAHGAKVAFLDYFDLDGGDEAAATAFADTFGFSYDEALNDSSPYYKLDEIARLFEKYNDGTSNEGEYWSMAIHDAMDQSKKPCIFFDMDGTLAEWRVNVESEEKLYEKDYFASLSPNQNVVDAAKIIAKSGKADVFILSTYLENSKYALAEKKEWVERFIPEIPAQNRLFPKVGESKYRMAVPYAPGRPLVLVDDYSANLHDWVKNGGTAIKILNGVNSTKGTWFGYRVSIEASPEEIAEDILEAAR